MSILKIIIKILLTIADFVSFYFALCKHKPFWFVPAIILIFFLTFFQDIINVSDEVLHSRPKRDIIEKFPKDLDFIAHGLVRLNSGVNLSFNSDDLKAEISVTSIYLKDSKFYIHLVYSLEDKKRNNTWIDQSAEVELVENNLVKGETDRVDFYFYVAKTTFGNADLYVGIKRVEKGVVFMNCVIKGNAIKFK